MIPKGMDETEVIAIIDRIANRLAAKFKFGYHELEDMKQQARLFAWEGMENYDGVRPLENFLWTHVRNRLYNFKRNNFGRPDKPCDTCPFQDLNCASECEEYSNRLDCDLYKGWFERNSTKKSLMNISKLEIDTYDKEDNVAYILDRKQLFNTVDQAIPIHYREDWIRFVNRLRLPKPRREKIIELIREIIEEKNIDEQTWKTVE